MKREWNPGWRDKALLAGAAVTLLLSTMTEPYTPAARADGPLAVKVKLTTLETYKGSSLPSPAKILVYDLVLNSDVQLDKSQKLRPRHLIMGDENPDTIATKSENTFSGELAKKLVKTGIPVEHATPDTAPSDASLIVQGSFAALREGDKTQRVTVGMGLGSAQVETKIDVHLKSSAGVVLLSQFQTAMTTTKNVGAAAPVVAGMNPAAVGAKSVIADRRKTLNHLVSKTADASAQEIIKLMAGQGWIKLDDKGDVVP